MPLRGSFHLRAHMPEFSLGYVNVSPVDVPNDQICGSFFEADPPHDASDSGSTSGNQDIFSDNVHIFVHVRFDSV